MAFENILSPTILKKYLEFWVSEDIPNFDLSSIALSNKEVCAEIQMKEDGVLAGLPFAEALFKYFDCKVKWSFPEGSFVKAKSVVSEVRGLSSKLMMVERTALNILSRASGVATISRRVQTKIGNQWKGEISGTRKTSPGMRIVEKYAMYIGGISTHRYDLSSMIMLKDNHIKINGSIENSVKMIKESVGSLIMIEVECKSAEEALEAARSGANVVMLDNFDAKDVKTASKQVKEAYPSILIEVSGRINENNILSYTCANVDIISSSIFCQGYKCIDLSLNVVNESVSLTPEIKTLVTDECSINDIEVIDLDIVDKSSEFDLPGTQATSTPKAGIKRKIDEASPIKTVDNKIVTTTADNSKMEVEKKITKPSPVVTAATVKSGATPNKQVKATPATTTPNNKTTADATKTTPTTKATTATAVVTTTTKATTTTAAKTTASSTPAAKTSLVTTIPKAANQGKANYNSNQGKSSSSTLSSATGSNTGKTNAYNARNIVHSSKNLATARTAGFASSSNDRGMHVRSGNMSLSASSLLSSSPSSSTYNNAQNMMRPMGGSMSLSSYGGATQSQSHNDSFFHGATPAKLGSMMDDRSSMNNLIDQRLAIPASMAAGGQYRSYGAPARNGGGGGGDYGYFCKSCNFQNPTNGPPICRSCRKMLF